MEITTAIERAQGELTRLTGLKLAGVVNACQDNGGYRIRMEMVEMSRIPPATDVLGSYEVVLDREGGMVGFERKEVRLRGSPVEERG